MFKRLGFLTSIFCVVSLFILFMLGINIVNNINKIKAQPESITTNLLCTGLSLLDGDVVYMYMNDVNVVLDQSSIKAILPKESEDTFLYYLVGSDGKVSVTKAKQGTIDGSVSCVFGSVSELDSIIKSNAFIKYKTPLRKFI